MRANADARDRIAAIAHRRAAVLLYAAIQFVALTAIAIRVYAGGYDFFANFLSELGATYTWSGQPNHAAAALFSIALGTLGAAFVAFASAWRAFAFAHGRARAVGIAGQLFGTTSGIAFVAVAVTPVNLALDLHNAFVIAAFSLLLGYAASMTIVWSRNGATKAQLAACVAYVLLVCAYAAAVVVAVRSGVGTEHGRRILVVSQKIIAYASMLYIMYLTIAIRRTANRSQQPRARRSE